MASSTLCVCFAIIFETTTSVIHGSLLAGVLLTVQQAVEEHGLAAPHFACDTNNSILEHGL